MKQPAHIITLLRRIPKRLVEIIFFVAVVLFFGLYLRSVDWGQLAHLHFNWVYLVGATFFAGVMRFWSVMIWKYILIDLGAKSLPSFITLSHVYSKAWMGRYLPGKVTWIAGKVYMAGQHGISKSRLTVGSILEGGMQVVAIMVVSLLLLGFDHRSSVIPSEYKVLSIIFASLLLLMLYPAIFNRLLRFAYLALKKKDPHVELLINEKAVLRAFILYAIGGFIQGISEFFITRAIFPSLSWQDFLFVVGAFNLAGALGIAALFAPSGLGVRDGVVLVLLSAIMPKEVALAVTVTSRVWAALTDVLFLGLTSIAYRFWHDSSNEMDSNSQTFVDS